MPSEKLSAILRSKSPFSSEEISAMSEVDGWKWVYEHKNAPKVPHCEICFTGFDVAQKAELSAVADDAGMQVRDSVTKTLSYLCVGETPGPSKINKAQRQGVIFLDRHQLMELLSAGVNPSSNDSPESG